MWKKSAKVNRQLIEKYFQNRCSPHEVRQILTWINSHVSKGDFSNEFQIVWQQNDLNDDEFDWRKAWSKLHDKIEVEELINSLPIDKDHQGKMTGKPQYALFAVAAAISFIIIFMGAWLYFINDENEKQQFSSTLPNVQKSTEKGQKLTIHLEDGSKVMLNAQSNLNYPVQFSDSLRELWLQGEAYFDVVKDPQRPFIIHTGEITTHVLGTSFNVNAYAERNSYQIALISGKVMVSKPATGENVLIEPGQRAAYEKEKSVFTTDLFSEIEIAWKDGLIYFENADFSKIKSTLERWYGVEIITEGEIDKKWEFSGKFKNESLRNILEALKFSHDFEYKLDRKYVYLNFIK